MKNFILDALNRQSNLIQAAGERSDANETALFARDLEYVYSNLYRQPFAPSMARQVLFVDGSVDTGADTYSFMTFAEFGEAKILTTFRSADFPNTETKGTLTTQAIRHYGNSFGYTFQELRAARFSKSKIPIDMLRASTARNVMERKLDELACIGDGNALKGLANVTGATDSSAVTSNGSWASASIANIVADMNHWMASRATAAKGIPDLLPDTLLLPSAPYDALAYNPVALAYGGTQNALDYLLSQVKGLKRIEKWVRLDTADGSSGPRAILFKNSPEVASLVIPQELETLAPEVDGMRVDVRLHASCGGIKSVYPIGISFSDALA